MQNTLPFFLCHCFFSEKFIDGVVNQLGRQSVNVDTLTPKDLDKLSKVITQALQVVDGVEGVKGREATQDEKETKREPNQELHQMEKAGDDTTHKGSDPLTKTNGYTSFKILVTALNVVVFDAMIFTIILNSVYRKRRYCP